MPKKHKERRHANGRRGERKGEGEEKRQKRELEEREKNIERRKLGVLHISPAIF